MVVCAVNIFVPGFWEHAAKDDLDVTVIAADTTREEEHVNLNVVVSGDTKPAQKEEGFHEV